jgi:hypothetical protein
MTLQELRSLVRRRMRDEETTPHLIDDEEIDANLNEAQREACVRALLIEGDVDLDVTTTDLRYTLDPKVIDVIGISTSAGNKFYDAWTLTESHLELARLPTADDTLTLRCYLLPDDMVSDDDEPQIRPVYHVQMADWAISRCYLLPDAELFDQNASQRYETRFVQSFGERPNALTHRNRRSKPAKCIVNNGYI